LRIRRATKAALLSALLAAHCASSRQPPPPVSHPIAPETLTPAWSEEGLASWYGGDDGFEGKPTASGEIFDSAKLTAAHRDLPIGTVVDVTSVDTGRTVRVRVNDRGPFVHGRVIDLSREAARRIGLIGPGVGPVRLALVSPGLAPTPIPPAVAEGPWAVQVGSFGEQDRADRHAERVRAAGFAVYFEPFEGLTRVKVGPFPSRRDADDRLAALENAGFEGIVVPAH
jgi:rare lipoprotein A